MTPNASQTIAETEKLIAEFDRHEQEDAAAGRRAEASRPTTGVEVPGLPQELVQHERRAVLGVLPRKSLWPELDEFNRRLAEYQARQLEVERGCAGCMSSE